MTQILRILIAFGILLSGAVLIPVVELPQETFEWQRYAGLYEDPFVEINHTEGQPGSFFTFTGHKYPANATAEVMANGVLLGEITTDAAGGFVFLLDSANGDEGNYTVTVTAGGVSAGASFTLDADAPLHPQEGEGTILVLPAGIAVNQIYLPIISR